MAAATKLVQLRPKSHPISTNRTTIFFSSSSSSTPDPSDHSAQLNTAPSPPQSPFSSSYFNDVKARLKQQQQRDPQSQPPRKPFGFSSSSTPNPPTPPSTKASLDDIRKNLSEFRLRSAAPPPPSLSASPHPPSQPLSFQEIYQRNVSSNVQGSAPDVSKPWGKISFDPIRESLNQLKKSTARNHNEKGGSLPDSMSLSKYKESFKLRPGEQSWGDSPLVIGGSDNLPLSVFGKELNEKERGNINEATRTMKFVSTHTYEDLGKGLRSLRPERKGNQKEWFCLEELNQRLLELRELEEKESLMGGAAFKGLRTCLILLDKDQKDEKEKKSTMQRLDIVSHLGRTPSFMLLPPKEDLVEKFFHPDNMSASEKMKLELKKVRDEFKISESDSGSARVQVAQLTTKIKHLSTVLHKKDTHSRKGLQAMVQKRKKLLKYLRRTDWNSYCLVLSKLGLRDNPANKKDYPENKKKKKQPRLKKLGQRS